MAGISVGHLFPVVCIRTSTERPEALDKVVKMIQSYTRVVNKMVWRK